MKVTKQNLPVMSSWLVENQNRLDASPFLSGAFEARVILEHLKAKKEPLQSLTQGGINGIFKAPRLSPQYVENPDYGHPYLSSSDILCADLSCVPNISKKQANELEKYFVRYGMTLLTSSGNIGRPIFAREEMDGMMGSPHFMRVNPDHNKILSGYLYAFLASKFGQVLVKGNTYGSIIVAIEPHHLFDLPVPRLGAKIEGKVHDLIVEASRLRTEYSQQVKQATNLLFTSVGLKDITSGEWHQQKDDDLGFVHNLNSHHSLRAVNFNTRFKKLCENIKSSQYKELGEICQKGTLKRGGRYKRIDAEEGFSVKLIGQRQLFSLHPEGRLVSKTSLGDDVFVESGSILVAAQGTLGESELYCRSEFIYGSWIQMAYSEHLLRIIANEEMMPKGCLFAFMRSETAFRMFRSISFGSKLQDHHPQFLPYLPVPYPDKKNQLEINEIVIDAYEKREKADIFEDEAIKLVEKTIEEGAQ